MIIVHCHYSKEVGSKFHPHLQANEPEILQNLVNLTTVRGELHTQSVLFSS